MEEHSKTQAENLNENIPEYRQNTDRCIPQHRKAVRKERKEIQMQKMSELKKQFKNIVIAAGIIAMLGFCGTGHAAEVGHVTAQSTTVSDDMNNPDGILQNVLQNSAVAVLGGTTAEDGTTWYHVVTLEGNEGYIRASDMALGAPADPTTKHNTTTAETNNHQNNENGDSTDQNNPADTDADAEDTDNTDQQENGNDENNNENTDNMEDAVAGEMHEADFYVRTMDNSNIRAEATTDADGLGKVEQDTVLHVTGQEVDADGTLWYQVEYEDQTGYISSQLVTETDPPEGVSTEEETTSDVMTMPDYDHSGTSNTAPVQSDSGVTDAAAQHTQNTAAEEYREATSRRGIPFDLTIILLIIAAVGCGFLVIRTKKVLNKLSIEIKKVK